MKKALKRILAILLATIFALGISMTAGAMPAQRVISRQNIAAQSVDALEILNPPTDASVKIDRWGDCWGAPDLSGMTFRASGGELAASMDVSYDEVTAGAYVETIAQGKLNWYFDVYLDWDVQPDGWVVGDNDSVLVIYATKYDNFTVEYTAPDSTEYGHYEETDVFYAETELTVRGELYVGNSLDFASALTLDLDTPADVHIPEPMEDEEPATALFKFTPGASGYYIFQSQGAKASQSFYTREGEWLNIPGVYPEATLYDTDGYWMADSWGYYGEDFSMRVSLRGGQTYYLAATAWPYGDYTITVSEYDAARNGEISRDDSSIWWALRYMTIPFVSLDKRERMC